jgi:cell division protein FtsA
VAVADIGAGTIDLALYVEGSPFHTAVLPVGGNNVTNDVAIGIKTTLQVAEELKIRHGTADLRGIDEEEEIEVSVLGEEAGRTVSRFEVCQIIEARMRETFEMLRNEMARSGHGMLPAGIILTGGGAQLAGTAELGREVLGMPVRIAAPSGIGGLVDTLLDPAYATAVGLLHWGATAITLDEPLRYESAPAGGIGRLRDALRSIFP